MCAWRQKKVRKFFLCQNLRNKELCIAEYIKQISIHFQIAISQSLLDRHSVTGLMNSSYLSFRQPLDFYATVNSITPFFTKT